MSKKHTFDNSYTQELRESKQKINSQEKVHKLGRVVCDLVERTTLIRDQLEPLSSKACAHSTEKKNEFGGYETIPLGGTEELETSLFSINEALRKLRNKQYEIQTQLLDNKNFKAKPEIINKKPNNGISALTYDLQTQTTRIKELKESIFCTKTQMILLTTDWDELNTDYEWTERTNRIKRELTELATRIENIHYEMKKITEFETRKNKQQNGG